MITDEIIELVRGRSSPGVLILDRDNKLLYANQEAFRLLQNSVSIPPEVIELCEQVKSAERAGIDSDLSCVLLWIRGEFTCSMRGFLIGAQSKGLPATHTMVLIEKVAEPHGVNLQKAKTEFGLTERELEVVMQLAQGLTNKEIGTKLFVSEHTVKDHVKNIMRKMNAASRGEIIYILNKN